MELDCFNFKQNTITVLLDSKNREVNSYYLREQRRYTLSRFQYFRGATVVVNSNKRDRSNRYAMVFEVSSDFPRKVRWLSGWERLLPEG